MTAEFPIDLTNYKDKRGARLSRSPGIYNVQVEDAEYVGPSEKQDKAQIRLYLRVLDPGNEADDGKTIVDRLWQTEASLWRTVAFLEALNIPTPNKRINVPPSLIIGKSLVVEVEDGEPWQGTVRSEVRKFMPAGSANGAAPTPAPAAPAAEQPVEAAPAPSSDAAPAAEEQAVEAQVTSDAATGVDLDALSL